MSAISLCVAWQLIYWYYLHVPRHPKMAGRTSCIQLDWRSDMCTSSLKNLRLSGSVRQHRQPITSGLASCPSLYLRREERHEIIWQWLMYVHPCTTYMVSNHRLATTNAPAEAQSPHWRTHGCCTKCYRMFQSEVYPCFVFGIYPAAKELCNDQKGGDLHRIRKANGTK